MPYRSGPVGPTGPGVHRPGRCTIQIFYHIGQGPVHSKLILTYRPADTYKNILSYWSGSGTPNMHVFIPAGRYNTLTIKQNLFTLSSYKINYLVDVIHVSNIYSLGNLNKLYQFVSIISYEFAHHQHSM